MSTHHRQQQSAPLSFDVNLDKTNIDSSKEELTTTKHFVPTTIDEGIVELCDMDSDNIDGTYVLSPTPHTNVDGLFLAFIIQEKSYVDKTRFGDDALFDTMRQSLVDENLSSATTKTRRRSCQMAQR